MELTSLEQDMLAGKHGEGTALAMKVQVGTGKAFYAKRMVPITRAHVAASAQEGDVYWVTRLVEAGARCIISPTVNPSMDLRYVEGQLGPLTGEGRDRVEASNEAYRRIGATMTLSCTPEIEKNVPAFGEIVAFSESSATPYVNSVLGARTNRESSISALCAAVTGRVPEYGLLLDENRRGEVLVEVEATLKDDFDWSLLGYAYPQVYKGPEVPVFTGIDKRPTPEGFVQFGAELATSGAVAMYHVVGITPEAPTVEAALGGNAVKARATITDADLDRVREQFSGETGPHRVRHVGMPASHHPSGGRDRRARRREAFRRRHLDTGQLAHPRARRAHGLPERHPAGRRARHRRYLHGHPGLLGHLLRPAGRDRVPEMRVLLPGLRAALRRAAAGASRASRARRRGGLMSDQQYTCRPISEGSGEGEALLSTDALCFAMCDADTGCVLEKGHCLDGRSVAGKVLVMPTGKGSSVVQADGLYRLITKETAPAAVVIQTPEPVLVSTIIAMEVPLVDTVDPAFYDNVEEGDHVVVDAVAGTLVLRKKTPGGAAAKP